MVTIKMIILMDAEYENVQYEGTHQNFLWAVDERKIIKIYEHNKAIYLNPDYIMSFELGDE